MCTTKYYPVCRPFDPLKKKTKTELDAKITFQRAAVSSLLSTVSLPH